MNRNRLETVRDTVRKLKTTEPWRELSNNEKVTDGDTLSGFADVIPMIDTLDMSTYHSEVDDGHDCRSLGCIAGVTIASTRATRATSETPRRTKRDNGQRPRRSRNRSST